MSIRGLLTLAAGRVPGSPPIWGLKVRRAEASSFALVILLLRCQLEQPAGEDEGIRGNETDGLGCSNDGETQDRLLAAAAPRPVMLRQNGWGKGISRDESIRNAEEKKTGPGAVTGLDR